MSMIYELPLKEPVGSRSENDFKERQKIKQKLESFSDFEKKLKYYNDNIRSLATYQMPGEIYYRYGYPDQRIKIYCGCKSCRKLSEFSNEHEIIYAKHRQQEVNRIAKLLAKDDNYKSKLQIIFSVKGFSPHRPPVIFENIPYNPDTNFDQELYNATPLINLEPDTKEDRIVYNEFVKIEFDKYYKSDSGFTEKYKCFDSQKEIERLNKTLANSLDPHNLLLYCRNLINTHFNYPKCLEIVEENSHVQQINKQLSKMTLPPFLFARMVLGNEIDLDCILLNDNELLHYTHTSEIVKFYKYLADKIQARYDNSNQIIMQTDKKMLSSLESDNSQYDNFIKKFNDKLTTGTKFVGKLEFMEAEIKRIENDFMQPIPISGFGGTNIEAQFSLEKYTKLAFDSLKMGIDREISPILGMAKKEFFQFRKLSNPNFSEVNNLQEINNIGDAAFAALQRGVAWLCYLKFVKEQLAKENEPQKQIEAKGGKLKVKQIALIYAYESNQITRANAKQIATEYGYNSANSGEGLFQDFTLYSSATFRKDKPTPCTPKKLKNKIELFKSILEHLSERAKKRAEDEIKILQTIFDNEYL